MTEKASQTRRKFPASDRLLAHWKGRRQAARRSRSRNRLDDAERLVDPGFDEVEIDDLLGDFGLAAGVRSDEGDS